MRLSWRRSSRTEDRIDEWIVQRHQERVLSGETTPIGPCPDDSFLRDLARRSRKIAISDPGVDHSATCAKCMRRLMTLREQNRSRQRRLALAAALAACLVGAAAIIVVARYGTHRLPTMDNTTLASRTVDLWDAATIRGGEPGALKSVSLPAALVKVTIILPRFSPAGQYVVAVTKDQNGNGVVAEGNAAMTGGGDRESIFVELDLRKVKAGSYFLATVHEQDQASYYYPLQIK